MKLSLLLTLPDVDNPVQTGDASYRRNCRQLGALFEKIGSGNLVGVAGTTTLDFRTDGVACVKSVALVNGATSLVTSIGGTSVTTTYSAVGGAGQSEQHDNETLNTHSADINANATVNKWVTASVVGTAAASEYVALSGTDTGTLTVTIAGSATSVTGAGVDDTDGAALAAAINANTAVANSVTATYNSGNNRLTITARSSGSAGNAITLTVTGTGLTANGAKLSGGKDKVYLTAKAPGVLGNAIVVSSASTGATVATVTAGTESRVVYSL